MRWYFQKFVENTICQMAPSSFELTKMILLGERLLAFSIVKPNKAGTDEELNEIGMADLPAYVLDAPNSPANPNLM